MKKLFATCALSLGLMTACSEVELDNTPSTPDSQARTIELTASFESTRLQWVDGEGISWENADLDKLGFFAKGSAVEHGKSTAISIAEDGRATFTVSASGDATKLYAYYPYSESSRFDNNRFYANYYVNNAQTQDAAGVFPMTSAPVRSYAVIDLTGGETNVDAVENPMELVSGIVRYIVYTETYNDESVASVRLEVEGGTINGDVTVEGPFENGTHEAVVNSAWTGSSMTTVTLSEPFALTGVTSKESDNAKGIYMAVAPAMVSGYKVVVTTDKAVYTFDSNGTGRTFDANTILNMPLNLDRAVRAERTSPHTLTWSQAGVSRSFGPTGGTDYYGATYLNDPETVGIFFNGEKLTKEQMKDDVKLLAVDGDGNEVDWFTPFWVNHDDFNLGVTVARNTTTEARKGYIVVEYEGARSDGAVVNQDAGSGFPFIVVSLTKNHEADIDVKGETVKNAITVSLVVEGEPVSGAEVYDYCKYLDLKTSAGVEAVWVENTANIDVTFPANTTNTVNYYTVTLAPISEGEGLSDSVQFIQELNEDGDDAELYQYTLNCWLDYPTTAPLGLPTGGQTVDGNYFEFKDVKYANGESVSAPYDTDVLNDVMRQMFEFTDVTSDELATMNIPDAVSDTTFFEYIIHQNYDHGLVMLGFSCNANDTGVKRACKINIYDDTQSLVKTWYVFQN